MKRIHILKNREEGIERERERDQFEKELKDVE
jgi:hypothetical protein